MLPGGRHPGKLANVFVAAVFLLAVIPAFSLEISTRYRSPRNPERKVRKSTSLIVLHTTEAPAKSAINKVSSRGECHYVVTQEGTIYSIVDRDKEAFHAGRSMWKGKEDVDKFSVGIECVGYHNKPMGNVQLNAIARLVAYLKRIYSIKDADVVCHCHVAYGAPNKWFKKKQRGRKRCAMLFATPSVRRVLRLSARPPRDPDVRAKRLIVGDKYLERVLYGTYDPMRKHYPAPVKPVVRKKTAASGKTVRRQPAASRPSTVAQLAAGGWKVAGVLAKGGTVLRIAGKRWNSPDTYYSIGSKVIGGDTINPAKVAVGTKVWMK